MLQCPDCVAKQRQKTALERINKPISPLELNPEPPSEINQFLSFTEYRNHFPDATFQQYQEERLRFIERKKIENILTERHETIPIYSEECRAVREMLMQIRAKDSLIVGIHLSNCQLCRKWWVIYKEDHPLLRVGFNLWGGDEEPSKELDNDKLQQTMNQIIEDLRYHPNY